MKKFCILAAFIVICSLTLTSIQASDQIHPRILFEDAAGQAADDAPKMSETDNAEKSGRDADSWFAALEGFFTLTALEETHAAAPVPAPETETEAVEEEEEEGMRTLFIENTTYVSVRDFITHHDPEALFGYKAGMVTVSTGDLYMEFHPGRIYCYADGRILPLQRPCFEQEDVFYVPLRTLATIFSYDVAWDEPSQTASLTANGEVFLSGAEFYDQEDYLLLARLIRAESGNQSLQGKIAVGNVILNRVAHPSFPDTIEGVIYDRSCGIQFTTAWNGTLNRKPTEECYIAAKLCLEGYSVTDSSLYFLNPSICRSSWIMRNRPYVTTIGDHAFYS